MVLLSCTGTKKYYLSTKMRSRNEKRMWTKAESELEKNTEELNKKWNKNNIEWNKNKHWKMLCGLLTARRRNNLTKNLNMWSSLKLNKHICRSTFVDLSIYICWLLWNELKLTKWTCSYLVCFVEMKVEYRYKLKRYERRQWELNKHWSDCFHDDCE